MQFKLKEYAYVSHYFSLKDASFQVPAACTTYTFTDDPLFIPELSRKLITNRQRFNIIKPGRRNKIKGRRQ